MGPAYREMMNGLRLPHNMRDLEYLEESYDDPPRAYHNLDHIEVCLKELYDSNLIWDKTNLIASILWHDLKYSTLSQTNEEDSVQSFHMWATSFEVWARGVP